MSAKHDTNAVDGMFYVWTVPRAYDSGSFRTISEISAAMFGPCLKNRVPASAALCFSDDRYGMGTKRTCGLGS